MSPPTGGLFSFVGARRHSWAHHKLATGTDSLIVSKLMGHVDGRMLATCYGHVEQNEVLMLREATRTGNPLKQ